jgi:hypothetical protein
VSGTNSNYDSAQWAAHLAAQRAAAERVTPILAKQSKNAPAK